MTTRKLKLYCPRCRKYTHVNMSIFEDEGKTVIRYFCPLCKHLIKQLTLPLPLKIFRK